MKWALNNPKYRIVFYLKKLLVVSNIAHLNLQTSALCRRRLVRAPRTLNDGIMTRATSIARCLCTVVARATRTGL